MNTPRHWPRLLPALALAGAVQAQVFGDPLNPAPRGATALPPAAWPAPAAAAATGAPTGLAAPAAFASTAAPSAFGAAAAPTAFAATAALGATAAPQANAPLPPDPSAAARPIVFGSQMFTGRFGSQTFSGFNPDYRIGIGDRVSVRLWGAYSFDATQVVDAQGNIFIPNIGPLPVRDVRNDELNRYVESQVKRTFRANVGVYAALEAAQPVKVYVTGFVRAPGLYAGLSSDSVLAYLDRAGGIDPERGSHLEVQVLRNGRPRAQLDLYRFLLDGRLDPLQLHDGDTVVALPRKSTVQVAGEVLNPYLFEFAQARISGSELLALARPKPGATHLAIVRRVGTEQRSEYHPLADAARVTIEDGDAVSVTADKYPGTILVRIDGAHLGERTLVLPYGATLRNALARLKPAPQADLGALQLYRKSVAQRQKEMLDTSLRSLETAALTARSSTSEEAGLRTREAELILQFVERARKVEPKGQVVLSAKAEAAATLLEDGDLLNLPERSNLVQVSGEVLFPSALMHAAGAKADDYVRDAGGYTQNADVSKVVVLRPNGSVATDGSAPGPGDRIMVLPRIDTKNVEVTRGITQILYQIAVSAKVLFGL